LHRIGLAFWPRDSGRVQILWRSFRIPRGANKRLAQFRTDAVALTGGGLGIRLFSDERKVLEKAKG
jgi:hypothetical protein